MARFYPVLHSGAVVAFGLVSSAHAGAQAPAVARERPALGSTITISALGDLPTSENALSLLDGAQADLISDRLDTGGLSTAGSG